MRKGEYKNYKVCNNCSEQFPLTREFFRRINGRTECFDNTCRKCRDLVSHYKNWKDGKLLCGSCNEYLDETEFSINKALKYRGRERKCRKCKSRESGIRRTMRVGDKAIERLITERFLSAKNRAKLAGIEFSITKDFLIKLLHKQNGECALSGIQLTFEMGKGRIPTNISIDRVNSNGGYTEDNVQIVCMAVNQMKNDLSMEQLLFFCSKILQNEKQVRFVTAA